MFYGRVTDQKGAPLQGIPVSDGKHITHTDAEGNYTLHGWERAHLIYVNALTRDHFDWFIYIDGRERYDFTITPVETAEEFSFLHVSDTEIEGEPPVAFIPFMQETVKAHAPAFFLNTGDICREDGLRRHYLCMNRETVGCPVRWAIGNHDFTGEPYGEATYEKYYGPTWYSFDCGKIHFVCLSIGKGEKPGGYLPEDQWLWLAEDLAKNMKPDQKLIIFSHGTCEQDEFGFCPEIGELQFDLPKEGLIAWVFGHLHAWICHKHGEVLNICSSRPNSGGVGSAPAGIRKVSLKGHQINSEIIYYALKKTESESFLTQYPLPGRVEYATPLPIGEDLICCTNEEGWPKNCGIFRIRPDGTLAWQFKVENGFKNEGALLNGRYYNQDTTGRLFCMDAETGSLLWEHQAKLYEVVRAHGNVTRMNVLAAGNKIIAGNAEQLTAYSEQGEILWMGGIPKAASGTGRMIYDIQNDQIILSAHWKGLFALDAKDGEIKWEHREPPITFRSNTPLLKDGILYTGGFNTAFAVDAKSGRILAEQSIEANLDVAGAPVTDGKSIYFGSTKGVWALDAKTLKIQKHYPAGNSLLYTVPYAYPETQTVEASSVILGDLLAFAGCDGFLHVYQKDTAEPLRKVKLGAPVLADPVLQGTTLTLADFNGQITTCEL